MSNLTNNIDITYIETHKDNNGYHFTINIAINNKLGHLGYKLPHL